MNSLCKTGLSKSHFSLSRQSSIKRSLDLQPVLQTVVPTRNTFVLKRKYPINLSKYGSDPSLRKFKPINHVYELVEDTNLRKKPDLTVILKDFVEGIGQRGDIVTVKHSTAYNELLVTGLADYATPEAIERAKLKETKDDNTRFSSNYAPLTVKYLENMCLSVHMNKDVEWTLEPWHLRVAFRKAGVYVPTESIALPVKPIQGPDLQIEGKIFLVTVTINKKEKATVRCLLRHWTSNQADIVHYSQDPWTLPYQCIFPEDEEKVRNLPPIQYKPIDTQKS